MDPRSRTLITLLLIATFVVILNETIMGVALPVLMSDLDIVASVGQWLTTAFMLTMAVVIPVTGFLIQRFSTRTLFAAAMTLFALGTLTAAVAPGFTVLLAGRIVQAGGTAIMLPLLMTTVMNLVPPSQRGRMMGNISIVISVAPAIGPTVSGLILDQLGWRFIFWIVLPIAVAALVLGLRRVVNIGEPKKIPIDVLSVPLAALGLGGLVYGLSGIGAAAQGASEVPIWIPFTIGAVSFAGFLLRQLALQRTDRALLDLRPFLSRNFTIAMVIMGLAMAAMFGTIILLPLYLQGVLQLSPLTTGLLVLPGGLLMGVLGPVVGRLYDRFGPRVLLVPGTILVSASLWLLTMADENTPIWYVIVTHLVLSLGFAAVFTPLFTAGLGSVERPLYSHGSAILGTVQQVAGAAGTSLFVTVLALQSSAAAASGATPLQAEAAGLHGAFLVGAVVSVFVVGAAFFIRRPIDQPDDGEFTHFA